jgi:general stress protein 26
VIHDEAKTRELWSKMAEAWFPGGTSDADLALVQVKIIHASYWDVDESKLVQLLHIAKALATGERPVTLGEHAQMRLD